MSRDDGLWAILLAAGAGRRMGITKGLLDFEGRPLITHLLDEIAAAPLAGAVVVLGSEAARVRPHAERDRVRIVVNEHWESGQTGSLQAGLRALPSDATGFLVWPVDHAYVTRDELTVLAQRFAAQDTPRDAILRPVCREHWGHPVLFPLVYRDAFLAFGVDEPGNTVYRRNRDRVIAVPVDNPRIARDLDRPTDRL